MPPISKVATLPPEVIAWLEQQLVTRAFSGYQELEDALRAQGYEISKSSLHRYGQDFSERVAALKRSQQMAKAIMTEAGDGEADLAGAVSQIALDRCLEMLMKLEIEPGEVDFSDLMKAVAALTRSSITVKQFQTKIKAAAAQVAAEVAKVVKQGGLSDEAADIIRRQILGIGN